MSRPIWTIFDHFEQLQTSLNNFRQVWRKMGSLTIKILLNVINWKVYLIEIPIWFWIWIIWRCRKGGWVHGLSWFDEIFIIFNRNPPWRTFRRRHIFGKHWKWPFESLTLIGSLFLCLDLTSFQSFDHNWN